MSFTGLTPDAIASSLERLRRMRHEIVAATPKPDPDGSLVPLLEASARCAAIDTAVRALEAALQERAS